jgi:hypothetical protein
MTTPKATPRLTGEQLRSIMWREEGKAQPRYSPEWYDDLAAAVLAALGSEGPAPTDKESFTRGRNWEIAEYKRHLVDHNPQIAGVCSWCRLETEWGRTIVAEAISGPVTPPAPGEELGTCDLVSRPHPRNCCGEAWRALAAPPVTAPAKE